jgi:hypothetical protein
MPQIRPEKEPRNVGVERSLVPDGKASEYK